MPKVFILQEEYVVTKFIDAFSRKVMTTDIAHSVTGGRAPVILHVTKPVINLDPAHPYNKALSSNFRNVKKKEHHYELSALSEVLLNLEGINDLIATVGDKADFIFIDSKLISNNHNRKRHIDLDSIDGIVSFPENTYGEDLEYITHDKRDTFIFTSALRANNQQAVLTVRRRNNIHMKVATQIDNSKRTTLSGNITYNSKLLIMGDFTPDNLENFILSIIKTDNTQNLESSNDFLSLIEKSKNSYALEPYSNDRAKTKVLGIVSASALGGMTFSTLSALYGMLIVDNITNGSLFIIFGVTFFLMSIIVFFMSFYEPAMRSYKKISRYPYNKPEISHAENVIDKEVSLNIESVLFDNKLGKTTKSIKSRATSEESKEIKNETWFVDIQKIVSNINEQWLEYEINISHGLQYPLMLDMNVPSTRKFYQLKLRVDRLIANEANALQDKKNTEDLVSELEISFLTAEQYAVKHKIGQYTLEDQKKLKDALPIAQLAQSDSATPEEKIAATKALLSKIEGIVVLPKATEELLQKNLIGS